MALNVIFNRFFFPNNTGETDLVRQGFGFQSSKNAYKMRVAFKGKQPPYRGRAQI